MLYFMSAIIVDLSRNDFCFLLRWGFLRETPAGLNPGYNNYNHSNPQRLKIYFVDRI